MSFGFSSSDFFQVCDIAWGLYNKCTLSVYLRRSPWFHLSCSSAGRDCPGEYRSLASEARQLTNVLQDLSDKVDQNKIPDSHPKFEMPPDPAVAESLLRAFA